MLGLFTLPPHSSHVVAFTFLALLLPLFYSHCYLILFAMLPLLYLCCCCFCFFHAITLLFKCFKYLTTHQNVVFLRCCAFVSFVDMVFPLLSLPCASHNLELKHKRCVFFPFLVFLVFSLILCCFLFIFFLCCLFL